MTKQEALDRVVEVFLIEKKPPAYDLESSQCEYYAEETPHGCAVGCLLDLEARKKLANETNTVNNIAGRPEIAGLGLSGLFLRSIQVCHDFAIPDCTALVDEDSFRADMKARLTTLAVQYRLVMPEIPE